MLQQRLPNRWPRFDSLEASAVAYRAADYDECLASLNDATSIGAAILRVRCLLRLRREPEALEVLKDVVTRPLTQAQRAEALTLRGSANLSLGNFEIAQQTLVDACAISRLSNSPVVEAEAEYTTALFYWSQSRLHELERAARRVLNVVPVGHPQVAQTSTAEHVSVLGEVRAKAYDLLGALAALRENFSEQGALIAMAFEELDAVEHRDHFFEARLLFNLAGLTRDIDLPESYEFVASRIESVPFGPYTKLYEFHIRRCLGWCNAHRGNHVGALREFRLSADAAPSMSWRMVAVLDRALLARELREQHFAQEELDYALRLCRSVNWEATRDEECFALFVLAQHVAPVDAVAARRLLDRYEKIKGTLPFTSFGNKDRRLYAEVAYASGVVLREEGDLDGAARLILECFEIWTQIGYRSRAATAAADLAELTGERYYFGVAAVEAEKCPQSWLASRLRSIGNLTKLTASA